MNIFCPRHHRKLNLEFQNLSVLGKIYPIIVGKCPECKEYYMNSRILKSGSSLNLKGQLYIFNEQLNLLFPPEDVELIGAKIFPCSHELSPNTRSDINPSQSKISPSSLPIPDSKKSSKEMADTVSPKTVKEKYTLSQIPVLKEHNCPFCKRPLDAMVIVKYKCYDTSMDFESRFASVRACSFCDAAFADEDQLDIIKKYSATKTIYTISPSDYADPRDMMLAAMDVPSASAKNSIVLPCQKESYTSENISHESKVVQVFANKCHCTQCESKFKCSTMINRTAIVDTVCGSSEKINVMFCQGCGQYFVNIVTLEHYKNIFGGILAEFKMDHSIKSDQYSWLNFAPDTVLSRCGYSVKEGMSAEYRHAILRYILETGKASKYEIIEKISSFIFWREHQPQYENACSRWKQDIQYVNNYRLSEQKKVYGLEFQRNKY